MFVLLDIAGLLAVLFLVIFALVKVGKWLTTPFRK